MRSVSFHAVSRAFGGSLLALTLAACGGDDVKPQPVTPTAPVADAPPPVAPVADAPKEAPKPAPSLADLQKKTTMGYGQAMNAHDAKTVATFYAADAVMKMPGAPDVTGRDAIQASWQKHFDMLSNAKSLLTRVFVKNDVIIAEWTLNGTHSGDMMGVKATEKPIGVMGADVLWFSPDGLIKEQHTYLDMGTIMSQIGASKAKGRPVAAAPTAAAPQVVVATGSADETKNVDGANKMLDAFAKKSEADFVGNLVDDIAWDDLTQPEVMKGKAAGKKYFAAVTAAFPDAKSTTQNAWGIGDFAVVEDTLTGTQKGAFFGIQPTKKAINLHSLDIMQFKDGKIISGRTYGNGGEMMMQLGLIPQPGVGGAKDGKPVAPPGGAPVTAAPAKK